MNAAVFYDLSIFNLFFPSKKNLEIGLGLVNVLNLGEFKAILAHEFGHLLGFEDAYLRGYDGDPVDPYGVVIVEWSGLSSDLMGDSTRGQVNDEMINRLISAYGGPVPVY